MLVLGIDPGTSKTGIAAVSSAGFAVAKTLLALNAPPFRYATFRDQLAEFLVALEEDPVAVAIEEPKAELTENGDDLSKIIIMQGIYAVTMAEIDRLWPHAKVFPWKPHIWRKPGVTKDDVARRMAQKYKLDFETDDDSDATGIADHLLRLLMGRHAAEGLRL